MTRKDEMEKRLKDLGLILERPALVDVMERLGRVMERGLAQQQERVPMLPSYLAPCAGSTDALVTVVDAGGTNLRAALMEVKGGQASLAAGPVMGPLPGSKGPVDHEDFFLGIARQVASLPAVAPQVGFCFSYPARITPSRDAILLSWTKEIKVRGVEGKAVGSGLAQALERIGACPKPLITVLNDTVAALMGGTLGLPPDLGRKAIGLVVGTGTNMAYFEEGQNITKLDEGPGRKGPHAINMESGGFDGAPLSPLDRALDEESAKPGAQLFEKMIAGRYLGELAGRLLQDLGLLQGTPYLSASDLSGLLQTPPQGPLAKRIPPKEREAAMRAVRVMADRAADLVAAGLGAVVHRIPGPQARVVAEGSLFWGMPGFRDRIDATLASLRPDKEVTFVSVEEANLVGAAAAAVSLPLD